MANFAVRYEAFCRALLLVVVVNVAMLVYTLRGAVVLGFFPSVSAAYATYRTWLLDADRSWSITRAWRTFALAWRTDVAGANRFGWSLAGLWALIALDYRVVQQVTLDTLGVVACGVLIFTALFSWVFTLLLWAVRAHYEAPARRLVTVTWQMVVVRPVCTLVLVVASFIAIWGAVTAPAVVLALGPSGAILAVCSIVYAYGRLPGMDAREPRRTAESDAAPVVVGPGHSVRP